MLEELQELKGLQKHAETVLSEGQGESKEHTFMYRNYVP